METAMNYLPTSVSVRILFHDLVSEPVQVTGLFPSSPETLGTQLHNIHVQATFLPAFLMQGLCQKVSIERALSMILAFLLASIIFVDLHILRKLVYRVTDKFVQGSQSESRLRTSRTSNASTTPKLASIIFYIGTPLSLLRINYDFYSQGNVL